MIQDLECVLEGLRKSQARLMVDLQHAPTGRTRPLDITVMTPVAEGWRTWESLTPFSRN